MASTDNFIKVVNECTCSFEEFAGAVSGAVSNALVFNEVTTKWEPRAMPDLIVDRAPIEHLVVDRAPIEPRTLKPAICSCCGGRIGKTNYCEYCGTRYW